MESPAPQATDREPAQEKKRMMRGVAIMLSWFLFLIAIFAFLVPSISHNRASGGYFTVFEVSYFSNGSLLKGILFASVGVLAVVIVARKKTDRPMTGVQRGIFYLLWVPGWSITGFFLLSSSLRSGRELTAALRNGHCETLEGAVQVLHEQPWSGHDAGDRIRIADKEFVYNYYSLALGYHRTASHGGELTNGVSARLHFLGNKILKVEIKR